MVRACDLYHFLVFESEARSRTKGGFWRTIKGQASKLRCPTIRKQSFRNSGSGDVADPRYQNTNKISILQGLLLGARRLGTH